MGLIIDQDDPYVVLYGVSWEMYEQLLEALGEYHLRHTYADGMLEMRGVLYGVTWADYLRFLAALGDYNLRHTYDGWHLEMMSPRKDHDWIKSLIGRMIEILTYEFDIPIQSVGSTTLTADEVSQGVQPDEAYYIAHGPSVRGKRTYDSATDPPPDLIVEVDVTKNSLERMPTFALLKIPEVWRHRKGRTHFFQLQADGAYLEVEQSIAFPFLRAADIQRVLDQSAQVEENALLRSFVAWAKQQRDSSSTP